MMGLRHWVGVAALGLSLAALASGPVAFVADIHGNASIEGDGKVTFLAELKAGTRLMLGSGAKVSVTYASSGAEYTISGPGEYVVSPTEVKAEKGAAPTRRVLNGVPEAAVIARISQTATASLRMRSVQPRAKAGLQYPVETRVSTLQPVLRFSGTPSDANEVRLLDAKGTELWKGPAQAGEARPAVKLSPAARYRWTVMTPQGVLGEAQFETLGSEALAKAARSRTGARSFSDRVVHAMLLHDLGATQEARDAWAALAKERPDLPELAALAR